MLIVAITASISSNLLARQSSSGLVEFSVLYLVTVNGWFFYSHHYSSRFEDGSLTHSMTLFPFLMGTAICIVNANFLTAGAFCFGAMLQRVVFLWILGGVYRSIERARPFCQVLCVPVILSAMTLLVGVLMPSVAVYSLSIVAIMETLMEFVIANFTLPGRDLIPINIEQTKDRLGALILIMLGETVVAATISNNAITTAAVVNRTKYYWIMGLTFLLIFMFLLLFFHMQPSPKDHAFRRSRLIGCFYLFSHRLLGLILLAVGVSARLMVDAVMKGKNMTRFGVTLTGSSVGGALTLLLAIRALHYAGLYPSPYHPPKVVALIVSWWCIMGLFPVIAFALILLDLNDPVLSAAVHASLLFLLCVIETIFAHILIPVINAGPAFDWSATDRDPLCNLSMRKFGQDNTTIQETTKTTMATMTATTTWTAKETSVQEGVETASSPIAAVATPTYQSLSAR